MAEAEQVGVIVPELKYRRGKISDMTNDWLIRPDTLVNEIDMYTCRRVDKQQTDRPYEGSLPCSGIYSGSTSLGSRCSRRFDTNFDSNAEFVNTVAKESLVVLNKLGAKTRADISTSPSSLER